MKYFKYSLYEATTGNFVGPAIYLPESSSTGYLSAGNQYYGCAEIESFDSISQFQPVEVTAEEYFSVINPPDSGSL